MALYIFVRTLRKLAEVTFCLLPASPVRHLTPPALSIICTLLLSKAVHKPTQQSYFNENKEDNLYFPDWQYQKGKFKPQGQRYHKFGNTSRVSSQTSPRGKRCFVCGKESFCSINHSQQERDDSKNRFGNRFPEYKSRPGYKRYLQN